VQIVKGFQLLEAPYLQGLLYLAMHQMRDLLTTCQEL
jgi:hypothetical protein